MKIPLGQTRNGSVSRQVKADGVGQVLSRQILLFGGLLIFKLGRVE